MTTDVLYFMSDHEFFDIGALLLVCFCIAFFGLAVAKTKDPSQALQIKIYELNKQEVKQNSEIKEQNNQLDNKLDTILELIKNQ